VVVAPRSGAAAEHAGRYAGTISCEVLPGQTTQPLKTELSMTIAGGQASYEREVLRPTSTARLGVTERGTGTVTPSGDVTLTGAAAGQTWSDEATYRGRLEGRAVSLSGAQRWRLPSNATHSRPCTGAVSKAD
jgi:hypothetical protein